MTTPIFATFTRDHSTTRPLLFDESNYSYWKCRMMIYLQSLDFKLWNVVSNKYSPPSTDFNI